MGLWGCGVFWRGFIGGVRLIICDIECNLRWYVCESGVWVIFNFWLMKPLRFGAFLFSAASLFKITVTLFRSKLFILKRSSSKSKYTILRSRQFFRCWWGFFKGLEALFNFRAYFLWSRCRFFIYGVTFLDMIGLFQDFANLYFFKILVYFFEIMIFLVEALFYFCSTQLFDRTLSFL